MIQLTNKHATKTISLTVRGKTFRLFDVC